MFDGELPGIITPEPQAPAPCLESALRALFRGGYNVLDCSEFRGRRNFVYEFELARGTAPLIADDDHLGQHIYRLLVEAGFDIQPPNLVIAWDNEGDQVRVGFLAWFLEP